MGRVSLLRGAGEGRREERRCPEMRRSKREGASWAYLIIQRVGLGSVETDVAGGGSGGRGEGENAKGT